MAFFAPITEQDLGYDGFFDGSQKLIPEGTELTGLVYDGFNGMEEGKAQMACAIHFTVTTPGEFFGQKYKWNAKIYDNDANKRDQAMRNLQVIDVQAGMPMTKGGLDLTPENIAAYWVGRAECRIKFGIYVSNTNNDGTPTDPGRPCEERNFIRGLAYYREKMIPANAPAQQPAQQPVQQPVQQQHQQAPAQHKAPHAQHMNGQHVPQPQAQQAYQDIDF